MERAWTQLHLGSVAQEPGPREIQGERPEGQIGHEIGTHAAENLTSFCQAVKQRTATTMPDLPVFCDGTSRTMPLQFAPVRG